MPRPSADRAIIVRPARGRWLRHGWIAALAAALALVAGDAVLTIRHFASASANYGVAVRAPTADPESPTGFTNGVRNVIYPGNWLDAQHWIMQTQELIAAGAWRVRESTDDNAGNPRPVHWGSPFRWWLACCGWIDHAVSGRPIGAAVERAALWANPLLLGLLLLGLVPWTARRWGGGAAAFLALVMVGTPLFQVLFAAENPDHHGLIQACGLICLFGLMAGGLGWMRRDDAAPSPTWSWLPDATGARRAFTLSAIAGAGGMWVSAAGTIPALAGIGLGALAGARLGRTSSAVARYEPGLWRRWGYVGGCLTLVAWLLEYGPGDFTWRLEVIHPVYALAWAGAGEVLAQLTTALSRGRVLPERAAWGRLGAGLAAAAVPVGAILLGGQRVFVLGDRFLWAMTHDYVPEGRSLLEVLRLAGFSLTTIAECLPMLVLPAAIFWLARRKTAPLIRAVVAVPLAAATLFVLLGLRELRWWVVSFGFLFAVVVISLRLLAPGDDARARGVGWFLVVVLFAPGLVDAFRTMTRPRRLLPDDVYSLVERDLAHALRQRAGAESVVVLGAPATVTRLVYFGGVDGLGTCYWENLDAMKRAAAIFAAPSWDEAQALVRAEGITHIVLFSWDDFVEPYVRLTRGLAGDEPITTWAFGSALKQARPPPPWLRQLPDHLPDLPPLREQGVLIFEVTDRTRPEQALTRHVNHLLYHDQAEAAAPLRSQLAQFRDDLAAQVALARLEGTLDHRDGFVQAMGRVEQLLHQAPELEPEDRVNLVTLLALGGRGPQARGELALALDAFDETALRRLTPGSLVNLLALAERLGVPWPDAARREFALSLVTPDGRP